MKPVKSRPLLTGLAVLLTHCSSSYLSAQLAAATAVKSTVVLVGLSPPTYPNLARLARISGDVRIQLGIRSDGSVESSELLSGHPMLTPAALQSARNSTFECHDCTDATASYLLVYTFEIKGECADDPDCSGVASHPPSVQQWPGHVSIAVDPLCTCDPRVTIARLKWRSAKCLYLWHCSSQVVDEK